MNDLEEQVDEFKNSHFEIEPEPDIVSIKPEVTPPDGGWGWVVCFACFMTHVLTDGTFYSFGIIFIELLDFYQEDKGSTAVIASLSFGVCLLSGPLNAALSNYFGFRKTTIFGTILMTGSLICSIFSPNVFYLYITFGISGWGFGMVYLCSIVCVTMYFEKRRAFAVGLGVSGSGIGTFIFGLLTRALIDTFTWKGAILIQAGLMLNCVACGLVYLPLDHEVNTKNNQKSSAYLPVSPKCDPGPISSHSETYFQDYKKESNEDASEMKTLYTSSHDHETSRSTNQNYPHGHVLHTSTNDNYYNDHMISASANHNQSEAHMTILKTTNDNKLSDHMTLSSVDDKSLSKNERKAFAQTSAHSNKVYFKASDVLETTEKDGLTNDRNEAKLNDDSERGFIDEIKSALKESFNFSVFKNLAYLLYIVSTIFYSIGYYIPYLYLPDKAEMSGIDSYRSAGLISSIGITNTIGRIIFGFISDLKCIDRLLLYNIALVICGAGTIVCPFLDTFGALLAYTVIFGMFSGVTISLTSVIVADLVGTELLADAFGVMNFFAGIFTFLGPPIAGWLYDMTNSYDLPFMAAGIAITFSGAMLFILPFIRRKRQTQS